MESLGSGRRKREKLTILCMKTLCAPGTKAVYYSSECLEPLPHQSTTELQHGYYCSGHTYISDTFLQLEGHSKDRQRKLPWMLQQDSAAEQLWVPIAHSSISEEKKSKGKDIVSNHNFGAIRDGLCVHEKQVRVWFCELRAPTSAAWLLCPQ